MTIEEVNTVDKMKRKEKKSVLCKIMMKNEPIIFQIDSGSTIDILKKKCVSEVRPTGEARVSIKKSKTNVTSLKDLWHHLLTFSTGWSKSDLRATDLSPWTPGQDLYYVENKRLCGFEMLGPEMSVSKQWDTGCRNYI